MGSWPKRLTRVSCCAVIFLGAAMACGSTVSGFGAIGDSFADEYQFYPPDRTHARNFVDILATQRGLDFGPFSTVSRGTPRNQGYANNWALDDATSSDLVPQTTGLAGQIGAGTVGTALVFIGGNDFIHAIQSPNPAQALA